MSDLKLYDSFNGCGIYIPTSYFHVIFISAYPPVQVKIYAYVNMIGRNDIITNSLFAGKENNHCKPKLRERKKLPKEQREWQLW